MSERKMKFVHQNPDQKDDKTRQLVWDKSVFNSYFIAVPGLPIVLNGEFSFELILYITIFVFLSPERFDCSVHPGLPFWGHVNIYFCFSFPFKCQRSYLSLLGMKTRPKKSVDFFFLFWQLVDTTNAPVLSLRSNLFVSTGELTHHALSTNCKSDPPLWLVKRKWHLWQLSSAEPAWKWHSQRSWPEAFFSLGSALRLALRVPNFQI